MKPTILWAKRPCALENSEADVPHGAAAQVVAQAGIPATLLDDARFLSDLCTRLWRVESRLNDIVKERPEDRELERLGRRFEEIMDTLRRHDFHILDSTGQKYDPGLTLRVLQFEERPDLREDTIVETVKPTLRLKGVLVPGEVIVGTPVNTAQPKVEAEHFDVEPQEEEPCSEAAEAAQEEDSEEEHFDEPQHD